MCKVVSANIVRGTAGPRAEVNYVFLNCNEGFIHPVGEHCSGLPWNEFVRFDGHSYSGMVVTLDRGRHEKLSRFKARAYAYADGDKSAANPPPRRKR